MKDDHCGRHAQPDIRDRYRTETLFKETVSDSSVYSSVTWLSTRPVPCAPIYHNSTPKKSHVKRQRPRCRLVFKNIKQRIKHIVVINIVFLLSLSATDIVI